ncbi:MAG: hypothetical protein HY675_17240 [Chloroflexi bacterium]|nr:hypothetical protein [Chloroflexota bacterium]
MRPFLGSDGAPAVAGGFLVAALDASVVETDAGVEVATDWGIGEAGVSGGVTGSGVATSGSGGVTADWAGVEVTTETTALARISPALHATKTGHTTATSASRTRNLPISPPPAPPFGLTRV